MVSAGVHVGLLLGFLSVAYVDWKRAVGWLLWVAAYSPWLVFLVSL